MLRFDPALPKEFGALELKVHYRGHRAHVRVTPSQLRVSAIPSEEAPIRVAFRDEVVQLQPGATVEWDLSE